MKACLSDKMKEIIKNRPGLLAEISHHGLPYYFVYATRDSLYDATVTKENGHLLISLTKQNPTEYRIIFNDPLKPNEK